MSVKGPPLTARDLANVVSLAVEAVIGSADAPVCGVAPLHSASAGILSFARDTGLLLDSGDRLKGAVIFAPPPPADTVVPSGLTLLVTSNPRLAFMRAASLYFGPPPPPPGIHPTAVVNPTARIHPTATVGAHCSIGANCVIGPETVISPNVVLYDRVRVGSRCQINAGTVLGADGFGYERNERGELEKFPHLGGVLIGDDVEIGSNTSIDRGSLGDTIIADRARIDNLVHVAHNVRIGEDAAVIALTMLGGSVQIGEQAWIAPGAVLMNQVKIGARGVVGLGAVVVKNVADGQTVMGAPAQDSAAFKATRAAIAKLTNG